MNRKVLSALILMLLVFNTQSGPLAPGVWTAMCGACFGTCLPLLPGSPAWITCMIGCCGYAPVISLLACFKEGTTVISKSGLKLVQNLKVGESVLS